MLAARKAPESVVKLMEGRPFVIENKFDGERVQVHKDGKSIKLFSRSVLFNITVLVGSCTRGGGKI
jgi:ATP-dependent DNA ligase